MINIRNMTEFLEIHKSKIEIEKCELSEILNIR